MDSAATSANLQAAPEGLIGRGGVHEAADQSAGDEVLGRKELEDLQEQLRGYVAEHARVDLRRHGLTFRLPPHLLPPRPLGLLPLAAAAAAAIPVRSRALLPLILRGITFLLLLPLLLLRQPIRLLSETRFPSQP